MNLEHLADSLGAGFSELTGQPLAEELSHRLLAYLGELHRWNKTYNLTAIREPEQMVVRHLLDSLSLLPWVSGATLDVGTGAGLPGVPLAIAKPELEVTLIDSAGKKVRFLSHVQRTLALANIHPVHVRVEDHCDGPYECVTSRAFTTLSGFAEACRHLVSRKSRLLAMKGRLPERELEDLPEGFEVHSVKKLSVPGLQEDRHLVIMCLTP